MDMLNYKSTYLQSLKEGLIGSTNSATAPTVTTSSSYYHDLLNAYNVSLFAYDIGKTIRANGGVSSGGSSSGGGSVGGNTSNGTIPEHNHDNLYAKLVHNHNDLYYTKSEINSWRERLIDGDLLFGKISTKHLQTGSITSGSGVIANGAIGDAQISKVNADKIFGGVIDTSKVTVSGTNGNLKIVGNRLQVFEGVGQNQYERVSLGDVNNDGSIYGLRVRGKDGVTVLYDENGVYSEGITDGSINNDKISDDANIDGAKLNINSVINNINENGTETIKGIMIDIDGEKLDSKIFDIEFTQNEHSETFENHQSQINQNKENINLKVSNQKYTEDMSAMTSRFEVTEASIDTLKDSIKLAVNKTELENEIKDVKDFVSNEISDITVGGANYINNSAPRKAVVDDLLIWDKTLNGSHKLTYWQDYNSNVSNPTIGYHPHIDLKTFHFPCIALINRNATFGMANRELSLKQEINNSNMYIVPNEPYTISFDAYSDTRLFSFHGGLYHNVSGSSSLSNHSGRMDITIQEDSVGTWKRYSYTFTTHKGLDTSKPIYLIINGHNNPEGSGYIKNIKLEYGKHMSMWTHSQVDADDSLNDVVESTKDYTNQKIKENKSYIDIQLDSITSRVEEAETTANNTSNKYSEILQTVNSITSRVEASEDSIDNVYKKYTEIKQTIDSIDLTGVVKFSDLSGNGTTTINGSNIKTGYISGDRIRGGVISATDEINFVGGARLFGNSGAYQAGFMASAQQYRFTSGEAYFENNLYAEKALTVNGTTTLKGALSSSAAMTTTSSLKSASMTVTGTASCGSVSTNGLTVYGSSSLSGTLYTSGATTLGTTLSVKNGAIYGMNNLTLGRGSLYIPNFGSSATMDYMRIGYGYLGCTDGGVFHLITSGTSRSVQIGSNQSLYLPHSYGNVSTEMIRLGGGIMACPSSGSFHFITASGNTTPIYSGQVYTRSVMSLSEAISVDDWSVFDDMDSIDVINTSKGLRLYNKISTASSLDESKEAIKTCVNDEKNELETEIDLTSAIATLWKAVKELREENKELKKLIKGDE